MNKKFLFMASAAMALVSCSNEELIDFNDSSSEDAISFRATVNHSATSRGLETANENLKAFYVTALEDLTPDDDVNNTYTVFFNNLLFTKTGSNGEFTSNPVYQWSNKLSLKFFAYGYYTNGEMSQPNVPGSVFGPELTITGDQQTINNFSPQPEIENQIDLVTAVAQSKKTALNASVSLSFQHILSEVQVLARCESNAHQILVKAMKFGNIDAEGNYDFSTNEWTINRDKKASYTISTLQNDNKPIELVSSEYDLSRTGTIGYSMLLPQTLTSWSSRECFGEEPTAGKIRTRAQYIAMLIKITAKDPQTGEAIKDAIKFPLKPEHKADADGYGWAYIPFHVEACPAWLRGYRFIYHLDFSRGAGYNEDGDPILNADIQFKADVKEWSVVNIYKPGDNVTGYPAK